MLPGHRAERLLSLALAARTRAWGSTSTPRRPTGSICRSTSSSGCWPTPACRLGRLWRRGPGLRPARRLTSSTGSTRWPQQLDRRIMVRLVKGAYWDTEIKRAQVLGLAGYPVFTRKAEHRRLLHRQCASKLLGDDRPHLSAIRHPQRAHRRRDPGDGGQTATAFEFQRLHGMGEALHETVRKAEGTRCRIYAPVGAHPDLLAYLVRRLLENGANSSFVHQIVDDDVPAGSDRPRSVRDGRDAGPRRQSVDPAARRRSSAPSARNSRGLGHHRPADARSRSTQARQPFAGARPLAGRRR